MFNIVRIYILASMYSGQDYHNFFTRNCKLSHGEWIKLLAEALSGVLA
jgi:hypothetical protein